MTVGQRLKSERERLGMTQTAFAGKAGITKNTQLLYETDQRHPKADYLVALDKIGVDVLYTLTGKHAASSEHSDGGQKGIFSDSSGDLGGCRVPLYDVEGAAGAGRSLENESVVGTFTIDSETLAQLGLVGARLAGVRVRGDSMEPTLFDGDWTFVNLDDTNFAQAGVFLVWVSGELRIKRVQRLAGGAMYLISDNTHYEKEMIARDRMQEVAVLGRVKTRLGEIS
ncbi:XRE family transcriptional regulator [Salinicola sp. LHM]|uniref:XRE family transcriptional regulator n=1 Tax=Salinicola sp. LHM TaxID=3065298 RepID=UPI003A100DBB